MLLCCPWEIRGRNHSLNMGILEKPPLLSHWLKITLRKVLLSKDMRDSHENGRTTDTSQEWFSPEVLQWTLLMSLHHCPPCGLSQNAGPLVWLELLSHSTSNQSPKSESHYPNVGWIPLNPSPSLPYCQRLSFIPGTLRQPPIWPPPSAPSAGGIPDPQWCPRPGTGLTLKIHPWNGCRKQRIRNEKNSVDDTSKTRIFWKESTTIKNRNY